ncbi:MAG: hypothetical protein IJQ93_00900 [Bacteroidales bacterium]|nr:hypothetical protein [Bacteroidales bacterium]
MKRQKLYIVIASIVLASVCTGCKKVDNEPVSSCSMTVDAVKTKTLSDSGSAISSTWTAGDVVTVWSADGTTTQYGTLTAGSSGSSTTLSGTLDSAPANGETLLLKYLSASYAGQDGTLTGTSGSIDKVSDYATAEVVATVAGSSVTATSAVFESQTTILKLTVKNASGTDITSSITSLRVTDGTNVYRVTPSGLSTIYVALPPVGSNQLIGFVATTASGNYRKSVTGKTLAAGKLTPVTLETLPEGSLTGLFTINTAGGKVRFSQGNLQAVFESAGTSCTWRLADEQYGYIGNAAANNSINGSGSVSAAGAVDLFGWNGASSSVDNYGINNSKIDSDYGTTSGEGLKHNWGHNSISGGGNVVDIWRVLTRSEWEFIISNRDASTVSEITNAHFTRARINNVRGLLLFPDEFSLPSSIVSLKNVNVSSNEAGYADNSFLDEKWALLEDAGVVFLPAAGYREEVTISNVDAYGRYWTQTNGGSKSVSVYFTGSVVSAANGFNRHYGAAVRLVQDVN